MKSSLLKMSQNEQLADDSNVEWGVSFIGGDPCGSKYNTDPHDVKVTKPGMPDDMKARIAALAAEKLKKQQEERHEEELNHNSS